MPKLHTFFAAVIFTSITMVTAAPSQAVDLILYNAQIYTMDEALPVASAIAIDGNKIVTTGDDKTLLRFATAKTKTRNMKGKTILPGFVDSHSHIALAGSLIKDMIPLFPPPIGNVTKLDDIKRILGKRAKRVPAGQWIIASGYEDRYLKERRHPTRHDLDAISTEHPIFVFHISFHIAVGNTLALKLAGITKDTPDPPGGKYIREKDGTPNGVMEELPAFYKVYQAIPEAPPSYTAKQIVAMSKLYAAQGFTTAQNGYTSEQEFAAFLVAAKDPELATRVNLLMDARLQQEIMRGEVDATFPDPFKVRLGGIKIIADGSIQGYTGYLSKPYYTPFKGDKNYRGYPSMPPEKLTEIILQAHRQDLQISVHNNGDAIIDDTLDAFELALQDHPNPEPRFVLIHAQTPRPDQMLRMARLGVIPSFFVLHTYYWGDLHRDEFLGPDRARRISPTAEASRLGIRWTIHTDAPVTPMESMRLIWSAVNRFTLSGKVLGPEQRVSVREALAAMTIDAARQQHMEKFVGSLIPGKRADLVVLSADPHLQPETIDEIEILETILDGKHVYRKK